MTTRKPFGNCTSLSGLAANRHVPWMLSPSVEVLEASLSFAPTDRHSAMTTTSETAAIPKRMKPPFEMSRTSTKRDLQVINGPVEMERANSGRRTPGELEKQETT